MLVLARKRYESIIIDGGITVTIVEILGDKVRIGIDAPKSVGVNRREVYDEIYRAAMNGNLSKLEGTLDREENQ
jgi:carbon storage regulator